MFGDRGLLDFARTLRSFHAAAAGALTPDIQRSPEVSQNPKLAL